MNSLSRFGTVRQYRDDTPNVEALLGRLAGVRRAGPGRWMALCPAHPDRTPSLSIAVKDGRVLVHCFAGCPAEAVLSAVGLQWRDLYNPGALGFYRPAPAPAPAPTPEAELQARWQKWWDRATPGHSLLRRYLKARGLNLEPPDTLRLAVWEAGPMMLARVQDVNGALTGLHLTLLTWDASARLTKRLATGSRVSGAAIQLYPLEAGKPLALAEGIETALAVHEATGWPAWACVSATGLERVALPPEAKEVVICADHDQAGLEAARKLAHRLLGEGRRVRLAVPPVAGKDWLDVVAGEVSR